MHIVILFLFLYNNLPYTSAYKRCCQGKNVLVNGICWDGSNVTVLSCDERYLMGPTEDPPVTLEIDTDDELIIEAELGYYKIEPEKYCMTREDENDTDLALVCIEKDDEILTDTSDVVFLYLKCLCGLISVAFLLIVFFVYLFIPELQDIEGMCIMNVVASLAVAFMTIILGPALALINPFPCVTISFIYFTGTLAAINWVTVISFHLWRITIRPIFQAHMKWKIIFCIYGFGLPILLIATALIVHHSQETDLTTGERQCLEDMGSLVVFVYFYGPIVIMILMSIVLQLWVAKKLWRDIDRRDESRPVVRLRKKSLMYAHLLLVMSTAYFLDMVSYITLQMDSYLDYIWNLNDCRTLLLGGILFFIFVVLRNKVLKALAKKGLFCLKFPKEWEKLVDEESEHIEAEETALTRDSSRL